VRPSFSYDRRDMQSPPPPLAVPGPTGFVTQVNYGGFWIRVVAYIIDAVILAVIGGIILTALGVNISDPNVAQDSRAQGAQGFNFLFSFIYFAGLWTVMGGSLGQRIFGMRVVDASTGAPIGFGKAALRWLGLLISFLLCFIGVIWVAFDGRKQGWMDKIAGTVVVRA
jgi:uncharacterized RDD family membrane protein YckC